MDKATESNPEGELLKLGPNQVCSDHFFVYKSGTEVACTKCPLGYPVSPGTEIKKGHIFVHGELLV